MSRDNEAVFVGGPLDGERRPVREGQVWLQASAGIPALRSEDIDREAIVEVATYVKRFVCGVVVWAEQNTPIEQVLQRLVDHYQRPER